MFVRFRFLILVILVIALPVFAQSGEPGVGDSLYPGFGNGGYDVSHYTLDLTVDPDANTIDGRAVIDATATQDLSSFNLDLIGFEIGSLTVNGAPADFSREGQELTITPAEPLANGATFSVEIAYSGMPEEVTSVAIPVLTGWVNYGDGVFVLSEPDGAANFYPVNDHPLDKATYTLRVTVPQPYRVAMNGVLTDFADHGDTTTTTTEVDQPMASYLTTINIAEFDLVEDASASGVPIRNYFEVSVTPEQRAYFDRQPEMIDYFETLFGAYPFDVYGVVVVDTETGSALESQTLSIFGTDTLAGDETELTVAHELVHQWIGDAITLSDWSDIWLHESWATYGEGLWIEHDGGTDALNEWIESVFDYVSADLAYLVPPGKPLADDLFNGGVYYWGALALHALRLEVGDIAFFEIARIWIAENQYGNTSTEEFIAVVNAVTDEDYTAFFDAWLYSGELPEVREKQD